MQSIIGAYMVRRMYLNADLNAICEYVLHFLWVLMTDQIYFDILAYSGTKIFSVLLIRLQKSGAKKGHFVSLP